MNNIDEIEILLRSEFIIEGLIRKIRLKQDKTVEEKLLLKYRYALANISEILIDESKWEIARDKALEKIKDILREAL